MKTSQTTVTLKINERDVELPEALAKIVESLSNSHLAPSQAFALKGVVTGSGTGACLAEHGPGDIGTTIIMAGEDSEFQVRLQFSYTGDELDYAEIGDGGEYHPASITLDTNSKAASAVACVLAGWGFELVHANAHSLMPFFMFMRGKRIPGTGAMLGIRAQLSTLWLR